MRRGVRSCPPDLVGGQLRAPRRIHRTGAHPARHWPRHHERTRMKHAAANEPVEPTRVPVPILEAVAAGRHYNPHEVLGQHLVDAPGVAEQLVVIRALRPLATEVFAILATGAVSYTHLT